MPQNTGGISLSLIVPAYNEEKLIRNAILSNIETLKAARSDFEIIIIDDGSKDGTAGIIEKNFAGMPYIKYLSKINEGFGSAVRAGIKLAAKEYVMYAPVDSPLTQEVLSLFLDHIGKADILVSYRLERKGYSSRMIVNSGIYHFMISLLFGMRLKDYNWIHFYKRKIFDKITIENGRIFMLAEVLIKAHRAGFTCYEFPVEMQERKEGNRTAASYRAAFQTLSDTLKFFFLKK